MALVLAGLATPAAAQTPDDNGAPPATGGEDTEAVGDLDEIDDVEAEGSEDDEADDADEPVLYEVLPGDYLASIAAAHDLDPVDGWRTLFDANPDVADPDLILPGQILRIPAPGEHVEPRALPAPAAPAAAEAAPQASPAPQQSTPEPGPAPATESKVNTSAPAGVWDRLAQCESGGNWHINTGNGYYGGLQFSQSSWQAVGGSGLPHQASKGEQIQRAQQLQAIQGWGAWPSCSRQLGLR